MPGKVTAPTVQVVCLDAVGTLIYPHPPVDQVYAAAARNHGFALTPEQIRDRFAHQMRLPTEETSSEDLERAYWRALVEAVFRQRGERVDRLFDDLWSHFSRPDNWRVYADAAQAWGELRSRGTRLAIASNFDQRLVAICRGLSPLDSAEWVFTSSATGFRKPSPGFYRIIAGQLGLDGAQCLMIGDDLDRDVAAPLAAGWQAIWLDRNAARREPHDAAVRRISRLTQLPALLKTA
jgi:putative hydrolase of the HAD superfamily